MKENFEKTLQIFMKLLKTSQNFFLLPKEKHKMIHNVKSKLDLDNQKKINAEMLQVMIDNESIKEQRITDYKNPYKPPPLPPQYVSPATLLQDTMKQEKDAINNLVSLGIDFSIASQVAQNLQKLPDGVVNLQKLNKNFPYIKSDIGKRFNPQLLDVQVLGTYLAQLFERLDESLTLGTAGTSSTNYFRKTAVEVKGTFPTKQLVQKLIEAVNEFDTVFGYGNYIDTTTILTELPKLFDAVPSVEVLDEIDVLPLLEKTELLKLIARTEKESKIPSTSVIVKILSKIDEANTGAVPAPALGGGGGPVAFPSPPDITGVTTAFSDLQRVLSFADYSKFDDLSKRIGELEASRTLASASVVGTSKVSDLMAHIKRVNKGKTEEEILFHIKDPRAPYFRDPHSGDPLLIQSVPTVDGAPPDVRDADPANWNVVIEVDTDGTIIPPSRILSKKKIPNVSEYEWDLEQIFFDVDEFLYRAKVLKNGTIIFYGSDTIKNKTSKFGKAGFGGYRRFSLPELKKKFIEDTEFPVLENEIIHGGYDPKMAPRYQDSTGASYGYGFTPGKIKLTGTALRKVGKGIQSKEKDRYAEFGKYLIHCHQLDDGVLNVKYASLATIPSFRPVQISPEYKEFVEHILETNDLQSKGSEKLFSSLDEQEKKHFLKLAKASGLGKVPFKIEPDQESKRFQILVGEWEAGNDNVKMIDELRKMLCKFIEDGRIPKKKGLQMLFDLSSN